MQRWWLLRWCYRYQDQDHSLVLSRRWVCPPRILEHSKEPPYLWLQHQEGSHTIVLRASCPTSWWQLDLIYVLIVAITGIPLCNVIAEINAGMLVHLEGNSKMRNYCQCSSILWCWSSHHWNTVARVKFALWFWIEDGVSGRTDELPFSSQLARRKLHAWGNRHWVDELLEYQPSLQSVAMTPTSSI